MECVLYTCPDICVIIIILIIICLLLDIYTIFQNCEILACFQTYFVYQSTCTDMHTMFWTCSIISDLCKSRICGNVDSSYFRPGRILKIIVIVVCKHFKG